MEQEEQQQPLQNTQDGDGGAANSPPETTENTASDAAVQNEPANTSEGSPEAEGSKASASAPSAAPAAASSAPAPMKVSRKRTKTGCLTCRKRRIKCGEERPTCANCIKSKRVCEGYTQRVVFKDGINGLYRPGSLGGLGNHLDRRFHYPIQPAPGPQPLQPIAPAPPPPPPRPQQIYAGRNEPVTPLDESRPPFLTRALEEQRQQRAQYEQQRQILGLEAGNQHQFQPRLAQQQEELYQRHQHHQELQLPTQHQGDQPDIPPYQYYQQHPISTAGGYPISPTANDHMHRLDIPASEPGSASLYGSNMFIPQYSGPSTSSAFSSANTAPAVDTAACPFNPRLDPKYAIVSGGEHFTQPPQEFAGMYKSGENFIPDSTGSSSRLTSAESIVGDHDRPASGINQEQFRPQQHFEHIEGYGDNERAVAEDEELYDYEDEDEDYELDYEPEEMLVDALGHESTSRVQISNILEPHARHLDEHSRISFRSFLPDQGVLTTYYPKMTSSPLMDATTAKIFCHFVYVLGPSLSLFERHPPNPDVAFTPGPHGPQNVWAYTIPMLSLSHPPLLHALLALSSLHISKLTKGPMHPSLLHYHIALRRLGKAIANDKQRGHVATLAATLILGYYETMAAEHDKWSSHIHGAKQLLKEIDFDRVAKRAELLVEELDRGESQAGQEEAQGQGIAGAFSQPSLLMQRKMRRQIANDVDESLTAYMMGGRTYRRRIIGLGGSTGKKKDRPFSKKELDTVELQADLFWWFAKMDCYQSVLSGCPLVLDYIFWGQCPPRARIGTLGTTYGSSDHFYLLLGRLADFQVRDLKRKKAVQKANGGMWIPPPEMGGPPHGGMGRGRGMAGPSSMGMGRGGPPPGVGRGGPPSGFPPSGFPPSGFPPSGFPPSGFPPSGFPPSGFPPSEFPPSGFPPGTGPPNMPSGGFPQGPMQFGMIPTSDEPPRLPSAFARFSQNQPAFEPPPQPDPLQDLEAATIEAEIEWKEIHKAFQVFQESLGHEYQPLPIEYMPVQQTPFGEAIYYRTFPIATLQMLFNMALIILHRCHPSMPAVSMMAAGVAAKETALLAIDIARITAGLVPTDPTAQINPALGASLIESTMPIFFAAVQYQDAAQRDWVVKKLREINRLTGWATASRVLLGCQYAWEKAAEMGKGPKYERPPFEEEGEYNRESRGEGQVTEVEGGTERGRFVWHIAGRRVAEASGILGDPWDDLGMSNLSVS